MPCSASARDRMSSTGFFHSRLCGAMADAGCWAFILGVFVIHPPNETQRCKPFGVRSGLWVDCAVGTYDARLPLHSLPDKPLRLSLLLMQGGIQWPRSINNCA